jgi:hypothetical protein
MSFANDYVEVAERVSLFFKRYPEGSIQADEAKIVTIGERTFITVVARAYRTADDERPGVAQAWETFPGKTNFTRDSEAMNAETSAIGRCLGVLGIASKRSIATREDVQRRQADQAAETNTAIQPAAPAPRPESMGSNGKWINEPSTGVTDAQVRKIQAQLSTLNVAKGERSRTYVSDILKRDVGSMSQLTKLEASKLIEQLTETIAKTQAVATIVYDETKLDAALGDAV